MRLILLVALLLIGCANQNFNNGMASFNAGNWSAARQSFENCVNQTGDPVCIINAGASAQNMGRMDEAIRWYTLAARFGNQEAISRLTVLGAPVPAADLVQRATYQPPQYQPPQQQQRQPVYSPPRTTQSTCGWQGNQWVCVSQPTGIDASIYNQIR